MDQAKKLLRNEIKKRLLSLAEESKSKQSAEVMKKLFSTNEWKESRRVATFLSMSDEVSTAEILRRGFEEGKSVFIPRYSRIGMEMLRIRSMDDFDSLPETRWKIKQPLLNDNSRESPNPKTGGLDLIIVPGLSFTKNGHRLGRGKGYYDCYLNEYRSTFGHLPITIGICFKEQIVPSLPCSTTDVMMDKVIFDNDD